MSAVALRMRQLRALGVEPLRLRAVAARATPAPKVSLAQMPAPKPVTPPAGPVAVATIRRLALAPDLAELRDSAIHKLYTALTEAVPKAGLQSVRPCDVASDPTAAVMVFGAAAVPEGVPLVRVLRADPLSVLHADRERKRQLWDRMLALGHGGGG